MFLEKLKYKIFLSFFKKKKKLLWTLTNNLISSPTISVLNLTTNTTLGRKNDKIFVTNDSYQTWYIMNDENLHQNFIDQISNLTLKNVAICPAAFNIVEELRERIS